MNSLTRQALVGFAALALFVGCESGAKPGNQTTAGTKPGDNTAQPTQGREPIKSVQGQYASVNGLKMYYEIHGTGKPLVLLHGAFGVATVFPALAKSRQVIAVELR